MRIHVPQEHEAYPTNYVRKAYAPDLVEAGLNFSETAYAMSKLSLREFEAARIRTANINGCQICVNFRAARDVPSYLQQTGRPANQSLVSNGPVPDEAFYAGVLEWRTSPLFSARERLAIEYAEGMGLDPQGIAQDEDFWARFKAEFGDEEIVDLSYCIAGWMGLGRMAHVLGLDTVCAFPEVEQVAA